MSPLNLNQISVLDDSVAAVLPQLNFSQLSGKRLFITGGTGFFGLWLLTALRYLNQQKYHIEVCVLSRNPKEFLDRNPYFQSQTWLSFLTGNVRDFDIPDRQFDYLLHAATETSMAAHAEPQTMLDDILLGTSQVIKLAKQCGVKRMLLVSSGAVYGTQPEGLLHQPDDSQLACNPLLVSNAYGEGKRVMELMGAMAQMHGELEAVSARCFSFCGPGLPLDAHFAMGNFIRDALYRDKITVQGDGTAVRSYLYGADLAVWLLGLLVHGKLGNAYNVGSEASISIKDLATKVRDVLAPEKAVVVMQASDPTNAIRHCYVPLTSKARALGFAQWTSLESSLLYTARFSK